MHIVYLIKWFVFIFTGTVINIDAHWVVSLVECEINNSWAGIINIILVIGEMKRIVNLIF